LLNQPAGGGTFVIVNVWVPDAVIEHCPTWSGGTTVCSVAVVHRLAVPMPTLTPPSPLTAVLPVLMPPTVITGSGNGADAACAGSATIPSPAISATTATASAAARPVPMNFTTSSLSIGFRRRPIRRRKSRRPHQRGRD
jgi:hypothetical protein